MVTETKLATELTVANSASFDSVIGSNGAALVRVPVASLQDWVRSFDPLLTPQDYGAVGDGVTDDSSAISDWIDALIAGDLVGMVPGGDYLLSSAITKTVSSERFGIMGVGSQSVRFIVPSSNTVGGLIFASTSRSGQFSASGFSVIAQGDGLGTGLAYTQPEGGNQHQRAVVCENVAVRGGNTTSNHFDTFFDFTGAWRPYIRNCIVDGPFVGTDLTDASAAYDAAVGFDLTGAYDPTIDGCYGWGAWRLVKAHVHIATITGVTDIGGGLVRLTTSAEHPFSSGASLTVTGTTDYNGTFTIAARTSTTIDISDTYVSSQTGTCYLSAGPEAFRMVNTVLNGCRIGLDYYRPAGREPIIWLDNNHINYRDDGFKIDGAKFIMASHNVSYNEDSGAEYSGVPHDFNIKNGSEYIITDNAIHFSGNPARIGIFVESDTTGEGDNGIISGNIFSGDLDYAVWLSSNVTGVKIGPNVYSGTFATAEINDASTSNDIIDGKTETTGTWTPALSFGGATTGIAYSTQAGTYKISGGVLSFEIVIALTSKGSATGNAEISLPTGLPGSLAIQSGMGNGEFVIYSAMASVSSPIARPVSATSLRLTNQGAAAVANMTDANFGNTSSFTIVGTLRLA